jgi:hypothetical protein
MKVLIKIFVCNSEIVYTLHLAIISVCFSQQVHVSVTYTVIVLVAQHVSVPFAPSSGVIAISILKLGHHLVHKCLH